MEVCAPDGPHVGHWLRSKDLAERIDITEANLSLLKSGKVKGVRFETLDKICAALECQPGDLLEFRAN